VVPIVINANPGASPTNTLTIRPASGTTSSITGAPTGGIIVLNGADWVTIDGDSSGGGTRNLTISNGSTSTASAVIWGQTVGTSDPATNNTIKNLNIVGNGAITTAAGIGFGSSTISTTSVGTRNDNNTIQ